MAQTPERVRTQVAEGQAKNLRNFKFAADPWWLDDIALTWRLLAAARAQAGDAANLIVDAALSYRTAGEGIRLFPIFHDVGIWFLEAPLPLDDVEGHLEMSRHGIPIGVGDLGLTHVREVVGMMDNGGARICQPDLSPGS